MRSKMHEVLKILQDQGPTALAQEAAHSLAERWKPTERHIQKLQQREDLVIAEIGVWRGVNAERLAQELDIEKMFLIDPYEAYEEYDEEKSDYQRVESAKNEAHKRLSGYQNIEWIEEYSHEAVEKIDTELDYVYVDGNHDYEYVKKDIECYYPLVKEGGIIAGDDIDWSGVSRAFVEFSAENGLQPWVEPYHPDWYFIKGQKMSPNKQG